MDLMYLSVMTFIVDFLSLLTLAYDAKGMIFHFVP